MIIFDRTKYNSFVDKLLSRLKIAVNKPGRKKSRAPIAAKKIFTIILSTMLMWTFLLAAVIYRKAHTEGFKEAAEIINLVGRRVKHNFQDSLKAVGLAPYHWGLAKISSANIPSLYFDIKFKHLQVLQKKREQALALGVLRKGSDDFVPALLTVDGKKVSVKMRLKGDWTDHLEGSKWSFRIHVKKGDYVFGMRRFSIQNPKTRQFEAESLYHGHLHRENILAPRYFFVKVFINGKDIGLMALEEHFSKELLESQGRKESVIIKFDESALWDVQIQRNRYLPAIGPINSPIVPFQAGRVFKSGPLSSHLEMAQGLLSGFVRGQLSASEVFDAELMGRFIAISSAWKADHGLTWHNMRFYYNPITGHLEPIGFDAGIPYRRTRHSSPLHDFITAKVIDGDEEIRQIYKETLEEILDEWKLSTPSWIMAEEKKQLRILHSEYPFLQGIKFDQFVEQVEFLLEAFDRRPDSDVEFVKAFMVQGEEGNHVEIVNPLYFPIVVNALKATRISTREEFNLRVQPGESLPRHVNGYREGSSLHKVNIQLPPSFRPKEFKVMVGIQNKGNGKVRWIQSIPYYPMKTANPIPQGEVGSLVKRFSFVLHDPIKNEISIKPGIWRVGDWLVIPRGMQFRIPGGTELRFEPSFGIISRSPIAIDGNEENPVVLTGLAGSGSKGWQGVFIQRAHGPSVWSHAFIRNTHGIHLGGWSLTGGINIYESVIKINNSYFIGNKAEDSLNIVRSNFELNNVVFKNVVSDAFDADFSAGEVRGGVYENIGYGGGGDAIDVSGSNVAIRGTQLKNISDKGISVGEKSEVMVEQVMVVNAGIGAASKDGSQLTISDSSIVDSGIAGLMAYIKKKEYGPGEITATGVKIQGSSPATICQTGNRIQMDGKEVDSVEIDVDGLYSRSINTVGIQ